MVEVARAEGAVAVAHGCTGKGNDQVRFDVGVGALAPELKIIAPARDWEMTREETIDYAQRHGIPIPITADSPYSIDQNLWGRSIECGVMEDPWVEPPDDAFIWAKPLADTPDVPEYVEIGFNRGIPVVVNGRQMGGVALIERVNELVGKHGVGKIDHIEDRVVGIKSREIYEAPAAVVLLQAHQALEKMTLSREQLRFKQLVAAEYADLIYNGLWFTSLREDLAAYVESSQRFVTGTVRLKLFKGSCSVVGRKSPYSLYRHDLATYDKGDSFDQSAAVGFIHLWGLPARTQARVQGNEAKLISKTNTKKPLANKGLTKREQEILNHVAQGYTNQQIAQELHISQSVVDNHIRILYLKLAGIKPAEESPEDKGQK